MSRFVWKSSQSRCLRSRRPVDKTVCVSSQLTFIQPSFSSYSTNSHLARFYDSPWYKNGQGLQGRLQTLLTYSYPLLQFIRYLLAHSRYVCTFQIYVCVFKISICLLQIRVGRYSSVGTATCYRLDSPGTEFSASSQIGPGAHPASYTMGLSRG